MFLAGMMAFLAVFALIGAYYESIGLWMAMKGGAALGAAWLCGYFLSDVFVAAIVPYFDRTIGDIHTFGQGAQIARNCRRLDRLAAQHAASPLSAFGFADDVRGETLIWHDPRAGIETIATLLGALRPHGGDRRLVAELTAIRDALNTAEKKDARFSLILRSGTGTNARELALRVGSFF